jgi:glycerol-3-phosphate cytidylyltransferase-like family protein
MNYDYIITTGCFNFLHKSRISFLTELKSHCNKLIIGIYDNDSTYHLKGIQEIEQLYTRKRNIEPYADDVFIINNYNPSNSINSYIDNYLHVNNICYMCRNDKFDFIGKNQIYKNIDIKFICYQSHIEESKKWDTDYKLWKSGIINTI